MGGAGDGGSGGERWRGFRKAVLAGRGVGRGRLRSHPHHRALGVPSTRRHAFRGLHPCPLSCQNEEVLKKCAQEYLSRVKKEEQRYQALKVHAEEKLDR